MMTNRKTFRLAGMAYAALAWLNAVHAQEVQDRMLDEVVVSASRNEQRQFDAPAAIDAVPVQPFQSGAPLVNLSELTAGVPGLQVRNRQNFAQDLQISIRGFGTRSTFGVRGVRILVDGIPATMPDGQGQAATAVLTSARRIEVLRGPLAQLYGNSAGGVVQVFTKDPLANPGTMSGMLSTAFGGDGQKHVNASFIAASDTVGGLLDVSHFRTDGYRDHSRAQRTQINAKLVARPGPDTVVTGMFNGFDQPVAQDPLGLSRGDFESNPRQVAPVALAFDTRKRILQRQAGIVVEQGLSATTRVKARLYAGTRQINHALGFSGAALTSSGGVVDLDRDYGGVELALSGMESMGGLPLRWTLGMEKNGLSELRRGFVNNNGVSGDLRRNERDTATNVDWFGQLDWSLAPAWTATFGARSSTVRFEIRDRYVIGGNPDDSGSVRFSHVNPAVGLAWHASDAVNVYANLGQGFETPTLTEIAYRVGGSGANLSLRAAQSTHAELGVKARVGGHSVQAALFDARSDDEIVPRTVENGRSIFQNVDRVQRSGAEFSLKSDWGKKTKVRLAYTYIDARFKQAFSRGAGINVEQGNRLPGVPAHSLFGEIEYFPVAALGLALEMRAESKVFVNDTNSEAAPGYAVLNARAGYTFRLGAHKAHAYVRFDNLLNKRYAGSVIVNDSNRRFYEAAPGRRIFAGVRVVF